MFGLTQQERKVILFLAVIAGLGILLNFLAKTRALSCPLASFQQDIGKVNLNTADKNLLIAIPGIGEKLAERIITYRREKGNFRQPEELKSIPGIGEKKYEKIINYLIVR